MTNAYRDENNRPTMTAILNSDGLSINRVKANPVNHGLKIDDNITGTDSGNHGGVAKIDENGISVLTALSSDGSGTIIELYVDSSGKLLIDSN
jgi:hypothetical protein